MALDFMAIVSNGTYPTPTPSGALRAALAVSYGLLNIVLPTSAISGILKIVCNKINGIKMYRRETQSTRVIK